MGCTMSPVKRSVPAMLARRIFDGVRSRRLVAIAIITKALSRMVGRVAVEITLVRASRFLRVSSIK